MKDNNDNLELNFERISILYANSYLAYLSASATAAIMSFIIYKFSSPDMAAIWTISFCVLYVPRVILGITFKRKLNNQEITPGNIRPWEYYYILSVFSPILCIASVIFIPYQENTFTGILLSAVIIAIMISGGTLLYSTSKSAIMMMVSVNMLFLIVKSFLMQDFIFSVFGVYLVVAYITLLRLSNKLSNVFIENIALKIENKNQSLEDPLTKLPNRRRLSFYLSKLMPISKRSGDPLSIIFLDIDHFKQYNDTHGHNAGDDLLVEVSEILLKCSRDQDLVARYGGEEFIMVLPSTNIEQTKNITERLRTIIKENTEVTISAGLAVYSDQIDFNQLIQQADDALYSAKEAGRDRFVVAENI